MTEVSALFFHFSLLLCRLCFLLGFWFLCRAFGKPLQPRKLFIGYQKLPGNLNGLKLCLSLLI